MVDKYGLDSLQVGGLKFIRWSEYSKNLEERKRIVPAVRQHLRRKGINFFLYYTGAGVVISRIS